MRTVASVPPVTLRRIMIRSVTFLLAVAALAGCSLAAAPERSSAAVLVGIGDQDPATFSDPLFSQLRIKRTRVFPAWNVALSRSQSAGLDVWMNAARAARVQPLVSFSQSVGSACPRRPCKLPSVREYTRAFRAFRRK